MPKFAAVAILLALTGSAGAQTMAVPATPQGAAASSALQGGADGAMHPDKNANPVAQGAQGATNGAATGALQGAIGGALLGGPVGAAAGATAGAVHGATTGGATGAAQGVTSGATARE